MKSIRRLESFLLKLMVICVLVLVLVQGMLVDESTRWMLAFGDPLEGLPEPGVVPALAPTRQLQLTVIASGNRDLTKAALLVNDLRVDSFADNIASVTVKPGDEVAVDPGGAGIPVLFRVVGATPGIINPVIGRQVIAVTRPISLGKIEWRGLR